MEEWTPPWEAMRRRRRKKQEQRCLQRWCKQAKANYLAEMIKRITKI